MVSLGVASVETCKEQTAIARRRRLLGAGALLALVLPACSDSARAPQLFAETASFDLVAGENPRLMVGVSDKEGNSLTGGQVSFRLRRADQENAAWSSPVPAVSLAIPGRPFQTTAAPSLTAPSVAVGVYQAETVTIPAPGYWEIQIDAGKLGTAVTAFEAFAHHRAVAVGTPAPRSENPTMTTPGIVPSQLDSLALDAKSMTQLPHPELHRTEIARAIAQHQPLVVVVATPAFCQSLFCGPLVDTVASLMSTAADVETVILEVFPNGYDKPVSEYAAQWIAAGGVPGGDGNEPWVFTVDASGTVTARWDNVVDLEALRAEVVRIGQ